LVQNQLWLSLAIEKQHRMDFNSHLKDAELELKSIQMKQPMDSELDDLLCQLAWAKARYHALNGELEPAIQVLDEAIARPPVVHCQNTVLGYGELYRGRLLMLLAQIHFSQGNNSTANDLVHAAYDKWRTAMNAQDKPAATASFELLQSWCEAKELSDFEQQECRALAALMSEKYETSPTAWYWRAEVEYRFGDRENVETAFLKLRRLRRRITPSDRLLAELIQHKYPTADVSLPDTTAAHSSADPATINYHPGSHAWFLMRELAPLAVHH
jgi:tetratricopeptide (TPR) repeat protein